MSRWVGMKIPPLFAGLSLRVFPGPGKPQGLALRLGASPRASALPGRLPPGSASRAGGPRTFAELLRVDEEEEDASPKPKRRTDEDDGKPLDPMLAQSLAHGTMWSSPLAASVTAPATPAAAEAQARTSLEDLLPALVRRIAWSGDSRRGTMRLELGAGALSGATLVVHADDGRVRVQLDAPAGANPAEWRARIEERLARRGLDVEGVEVE